MKQKLAKRGPDQISIATRLYAVQKERKELEELELALKESLIEILKHQGVTSVKLEDGTLYMREHRTTLKIKDEPKAFIWASDKGCLKVDTTKATKILRRDLAPLPEFFEMAQGPEFLSVRGPKEVE